MTKRLTGSSLGILSLVNSLIKSVVCRRVSRLFDTQRIVRFSSGFAINANLLIMFRRANVRPKIFEIVFGEHKVIDLLVGRARGPDSVGI